MASELQLVAPPANARLNRLAQRWRANAGLLFVAPAVIIFIIFGLYTVAYAIGLGFFRWNGFGRFSLFPYACDPPVCKFVGLENFARFLYEEPTISRFFWLAFQHNLIIAVVVTAGTVLVALPLAIALNGAVRGQSVYRTLIMLPMVTAGIAVYYVWSFIYEPDGLLNWAFQNIGLNLLHAKQGWLAEPDRALAALMVVMVWGSVPMATILYLAGLQTVDKELYEAAVIDGANAWQTLWKITWPLLYPVTVIIVITSINAAMQGYEMVYLMTRGGPAGHTEVIGLQIFQYGFGDRKELGMVSAMSWALFAVTFVVALLNVRVFRSRRD